MRKKAGGLFAGVIFGLILFVTFTVVLFKNEGNAVHRAKALEHIDDAVEISAAQDGDLAIMSGDLYTDDELVDETFNVVAPKNTIKLKKSVYMYQWEEYSETDDNDNTTYDYDKIWSSRWIDSSSFERPSGHQNPETMIYSDDLYVADTVGIGEYELEDEFINQLNKYNPYKNMDVTIADLYSTVNENIIFISAEGGTDITSPDIGDYKIEYEIVSAETVTVVGGKSGNNIVSYHTKTGNLAELSYGTKDKAVLKQEKVDENNRRTWAIRIASVIALMFAIGMLFSPLTKLTGNIPILGNIINGGVALVGGVIGGAWGILVIAVGWLYYKPVFAVSLIVGVIAVVVLVSRSRKEKAQQA